MVQVSVIDRAPRSSARLWSRRRWGGLIGGVLLGVAGLVALGFAFLLGYAPRPWSPVVFGVGMPGGLMIGCLGLTFAVGGAALAVGALRRR